MHRYGELLTEADRAHAARSRATRARERGRRASFSTASPSARRRYRGALRFFARGELEEGAAQDAVLKRYFEAACLALFAMRRLLKQERYDVVIGHHGIYVPQALVAAAAHEAGVRFVAWNPAYRTGCFIFSHDETYHRAMLSEPASVWENLRLDEAERRRLIGYLYDREKGTQDWIAFHPADAHASGDIVKQIGLDPEKPVVTLLTSVVWDAQLHYRQRAFANQVEWVLKTIEHFASRKDIQLAIRVHPAEVTGSLPSRQPIAAEIDAAFPKLPKKCRADQAERRGQHLCFGGGLRCRDHLRHQDRHRARRARHPGHRRRRELAQGQGDRLRLRRRQAYETLLAALPLGQGLDAERTARAQRYAYHFFFRRMIELPGLRRAQMQGAPYEIAAPQGLAAFGPGASAALDCVCRGVLNRSPFVLDDA